MRSIVRLQILLALATAPAAAATLHTDTFDPPVADGSTLGWGGSSPAAAHIATGGPTGAGDGYLKIVANETFYHLASYNLGPNWIGNLAAIGANRVTADLMSPTDVAVLQVRLVLFSTNGDRWTSTLAQSVPTDGVWRNYTFSFAEADMTRTQGIGTYAQMLTTIDRVMLRHQEGAPISTGTVVISPVDFQNDFTINDVDLTDPTQGFYARFGVDLQGSDFLSWQRAYQGPLGVLNADNIRLAASPVTPVPEPAGGIMAGAAVLLFWRRHLASALVGAF